MDVLRNNEAKVMCPYNPSHHIRKFRMEVHLTKCRKQYNELTNPVLVECDFNSLHRIPQIELQYHHDTCPDRKALELQIFSEEAPVVAPFATRPPMPVPVDESWDDVDVPSYNPQKYCEEHNVLRHLDTESASKRRDFRIAERHRLNNLVKSSVSGTSEPIREVLRADNRNTLPPTPRFSTTTTVEQAPANVLDMINKLSMTPQRAIIPKQK